MDCYRRDKTSLDNYGRGKSLSRRKHTLPFKVPAPKHNANLKPPYLPKPKTPKSILNLTPETLGFRV